MARVVRRMPAQGECSTMGCRPPSPALPDAPALGSPRLFAGSGVGDAGQTLEGIRLPMPLF